MPRHRKSEARRWYVPGPVPAVRAVLASRALRRGVPAPVSRHGVTRARPAGAYGAARLGRPSGSARLVRPFAFGNVLRPFLAGNLIRPVRSVNPRSGRLMTPWLAAGAGIVVAAVLALNVPHPVLTYIHTYPGTNCDEPSCGSVSPGHQLGGLAAKDPGIELKHANHTAAAGATPPAPVAKDPAAQAHAGIQGPHYPAAPVEVQYQTLQRWPSGFTALITIMSQATLSNWRLAFKYPGAGIDSVAGAKWAARGDGGVATAVPWPWGRPPGDVVRIMIVANGTPGQPTACWFDRARCSFG